MANLRLCTATRHGVSAPLKALQQEFGFTVENVMATVKSLLHRKAA
jgi:transketolase